MATETLSTHPSRFKPSSASLSLAQLIERHRMAKAAWKRSLRSERARRRSAFRRLGEAHAAVAYAPRANDAEFIEKLRFLFIEEQDWGDWIDTSVGSPGGSIFAALEIQFEA